MMSVAEFMQNEKITKDMVEEICDESAYWESCSDFIIKNWDRDIQSLTQKQFIWLDKIRDDLTEKRIEGRL